jgi:hypothetical protein
VTATRFSALDGPCTNADGCRCLLIGIYGAWPEAQTVQSKLTAGVTVRLAHKDLDHLIDGGKARRHGVESDRLSLAMLEATRAESWDMDLAVERYQEVLKDAKADRDLSFVVPAYLRLCELLEKKQRYREALAVVDRFLQRFEDAPRSPRQAPDIKLIEAMKLRRTRLVALQR